ncbi:MAG: hypothetical protein WBB46_01675, partial [Candidatus Deferrimicrobiaceae bacterium]
MPPPSPERICERNIHGLALRVQHFRLQQLFQGGGDFLRRSRVAAIIASGSLSVLRNGDFRGGLPQPVELVKFPDA